MISLSIRKYFFFSIWASFLRYWQFTVQQVRKDDHIFFFFTTSYHSKIFRHLYSFFISILKLRCLKNKHVLRIFFSFRIFRYLFLCSQLKQKLLIWFQSIRIKLLTRFRMLRDHYSVHVKLNWMFKLEHLKETIAVFISNATWDHEMSFEIKHSIKQNFRLKLENS